MGTTMMKTAFGLDLAGYSSGRSALAYVRKGPNKIEALVLTEHPFARTPKKHPFKGIISDERQAIRTCTLNGKLYVDTAIDLQGLDRVDMSQNITEPWQLQKRPVDEAFKALAPLASYLGAIVARFRWLMKDNHDLGTRIFETYPAGSLDLLSSKKSIEMNTSYKQGRACWKDGRWAPARSSSKQSDKQRKRNRSLADIAVAFRIRGSDEFAKKPMSDDEFDAIVCGLTGTGGPKSRLQGRQLEEEISERLKPFKGSREAPQGYRLLKGLPPEPIQLVRRVRWNDYIEGWTEGVGKKTGVRVADAHPGREV